jgi:hypothetical protein
MKLRYSLFWLLIVFSLLIGKSVQAQTEIVIDYNSKAFQSRKLQVGAIGVSVSYNPYTPDQGSAENAKNLIYQISYNGEVKVEKSDLTRYTGHVSLKNIDGDHIPEVIVSNFSGGAHCCTNIEIYSWRGTRFTETQTGFLDGEGGVFQDLNGDGKQEFLTSDNAFLYAFSSYAGSFPPSAIYEFRNGKLEEATRKYPKYLRSRLQEMFKVYKEQRNHSDINGVIAGYVAQKALVGDFKQGWDFMLANYDRSSDWGLARYDNKGKEIGRYRDFPAALKALLIQRGYVDAKGRIR